MAKTRISIVRYLNAVPLAWGILEGPQSDAFDPVLNTPGECADQLRAGTVDIGLIPSIEYQRIKGTRIVPGPVIACRHRVRSVLLVSQVPLWRVRTVAADNGSRTSIALAKIIFSEFYHNRPEFRPALPNLAEMLANNDAAVIIGDAALKFMEENEQPNVDKQKDLIRFGAEPIQVFDLVERWKFLTGLPFVFAFWSVREGFREKGVVGALAASRDYGMAHIDTIVAKYAQELSMKEEYLREYLLRNVHYYADEACIEGLRLFFEKAAAVGAIRDVRPLEFL